MSKKTTFKRRLSVLRPLKLTLHPTILTDAEGVAPAPRAVLLTLARQGPLQMEPSQAAERHHCAVREVCAVRVTVGWNGHLWALHSCGNYIKRDHG